MNPADKGFIERWSDIINSVDKTTIPIEYVKRVTVNIDDTNHKTIDIDKMKRQGLSFATIESVFYETITNSGIDINNADFYVDIDAVARLVQNQTNKLLNLD